MEQNPSLTSHAVPRKNTNIWFNESILCLCLRPGISVSVCRANVFGESHSVSQRCNECLRSVCVLIMGDRYHQSWHHCRINERAVFSSSTVSLPDPLSESRSIPETLNSISSSFYHNLSNVWLKSRRMRLAYLFSSTKIIILGIISWSTTLCC